MLILKNTKSTWKPFILWVSMWRSTMRSLQFFNFKWSNETSSIFQFDVKQWDLFNLKRSNDISSIWSEAMGSFQFEVKQWDLFNLKWSNEIFSIWSEAMRYLLQSIHHFPESTLLLEISCVPELLQWLQRRIIQKHCLQTMTDTKRLQYSSWWFGQVNYKCCKIKETIPNQICPISSSYLICEIASRSGEVY